MNRVEIRGKAEALKSKAKPAVCNVTTNPVLHDAGVDDEAAGRLRHPSVAKSGRSIKRLKILTRRFSGSVVLCGCVRLTNREAVRVPVFVKPETPVLIH